MRTVRCLVCSFRLTRVHDVSVLSRNCALDTVPQAASPQPRTPTRKARPGLHLEVSSATRAPRAFKKRGAFGGDDDGDAESDRIKTLTARPCAAAAVHISHSVAKLLRCSKICVRIICYISKTSFVSNRKTMRFYRAFQHEPCSCCVVAGQPH